MKFFLNRNLARGWLCWHSTWEELKAKRDSMRRSLSHLINRELSRGWGAWVEMAIERAEFLQKLRKGLSFMINRRSALAFAGWLYSIERAQNQNRKADAMSRALKTFINRKLSRGWESWHTLLEAQTAKLEVQKEMVNNPIAHDLKKGLPRYYSYGAPHNPPSLLRLLRAQELGPGC